MDPFTIVLLGVGILLVTVFVWSFILKILLKYIIPFIEGLLGRKLVILRQIIHFLDDKIILSAYAIENLWNGFKEHIIGIDTKIHIDDNQNAEVKHIVKVNENSNEIIESVTHTAAWDELPQELREKYIVDGQSEFKLDTKKTIFEAIKAKAKERGIGKELVMTL